MNKRLALLCQLATAGMFCAIAPGVHSQPLIPPFSSAAGLPASGWQPLNFPDIERQTDYRLIDDGAQQVVHAHSNNSASGLTLPLNADPLKTPILRWRWRISGVYEKGSVLQKSGDDYPARIYVAFAFEPDKASWWERGKRALIEEIYGETPPGKTLTYIWANHLPAGSAAPSPYTPNSQMIAVDSGNAKAGQWTSHQRNLVADFRARFGDAPPPIVGIAIMTDSDNTHEAAEAWYGDIELLSREVH